MSSVEIAELGALREWLSSFPQVQEFFSDKENNSLLENDLHSSNQVIQSAILAAAVEVCNVTEASASTSLEQNSGDLWATILSLTRKTPSNRRKSIDPPQQQPWEDLLKYTALGNLLNIAVSHKDMGLRRAYIQRIMALSPTTQKYLMGIIDKRKKQRKQKSSEEPTPNATTPNKTSQKNSPDHKALSSPRQPPTSYERSTNKSPQSRSPRTPVTIAPRPSFLRRPTADDTPPESSDDIKRRRNTFGSPMLQPKSKRLPPSSSERNRDSAYSKRNMFSPGLGDTKEYETHVQGLRDENDELTRQLLKSRQKEEELSRKMDDLEEHYRKQMIKVEREGRERDESAKHRYDTEIIEIKGKLKSITEEYNKACKERDELAKLKDEMEVMTHNKVLFEETTERLQTYKEKLQQLSDVKDALEREEEAHGRSVEENLRLRNELKNLQPLKKQLDEYKARAVDAEVRLTDVQDELNKLKEQKNASSEVTTQLEQYVMAQEAEIKELVRRVQQNDAIGKDDAGVGNGMSELNPELKQEMLSLRNENEQLRAFAQKREEDEVTKLEQSAEDKNMLAERFKVQFLSTKDKLESTEISLADSKSREAKLQEEVTEKTKIGERFKSQFLSTKSQLESTQHSLQDSKERESSLRKELADSLKKIKDTQLEVEEVSQQLSKCTEDLKVGMERESKLEAELASWTSEVNGLQQKSNDLSLELSKRTNELEYSLKKEKTMDAEVTELKNDLRLLRKRCNGLTDQQKHLTLELEQSRCRESEMEITVREWMERTEEAKENSGNLVKELEERTRDLNESKQSVANLEKELQHTTSVKEEAEREIEILTTKLNETSASLEKTCKSLDQSMQRYLDVQTALSEMTNRAEHAESLSSERMESLQSVSDKMQAAEISIAQLTQEKEELSLSVKKWFTQSEVDQNKCKNLEKQIEATQQSLELTEGKLLETQGMVEMIGQEKGKLQQELEHLTSLLRTTETELLKAKDQNEVQANEIEVMWSQKESLQKKSKLDESSIEVLTKELLDTKEQVEEYEEKEKILNGRLDEAEASIEELENKLRESMDNLKVSQTTAKELEENGMISETQLKNLEEVFSTLEAELAETNAVLKATKEKEVALEEKIKQSAEQVEHNEKIIAELESDLESETQGHETTSAERDKCQAELRELQTKFKAHEEDLYGEREKTSSTKKELEEIRNELNTVRESLSSSQHREKMLKHENTKLEDKKRECEEELSKLKANFDDTLQQSSKSLDSVREKMSSKAQKDMDALHQKMNKLLEEERKGRREQESLYKEQIGKLNQQYNQELLRLKEGGNAELEKLVQEKESELESLKLEYEDKIQDVEAKAAVEKEKLMEKGKGMIKDIREKKDEIIRELTDDVNYLENKIINEEEEKKRLGQQFQTKIVEYKKKLNMASGRINTLSADNNDYEDRVQHLEREKYKLREENDRYRRQLGGRSGSDSAFQNQLDTLQNEFKNAVEENRELKRKLQGQDNLGTLSSISEDSLSSRPYTRSARASQSTLVQLRAEYEETIESLNDEKRELIMKNSAAITDVQKAEKRAWLVEQDNAILKQDLTSLKLSNERLENMLADLQQESSMVHQNDLSYEDSGIPRPPNPEAFPQFDETAATRKRRPSYGSERRRSRDNAVLGTNHEFTNGSSEANNNSGYDYAPPEKDLKSFSQPPLLRSPYQNHSLR